MNLNLNLLPAFIIAAVLLVAIGAGLASFVWWLA